MNLTHRLYHSARCRGFTLVELLCAMGIITIVIALAAKVLFYAIDEARRIACLNNLRHMAIAAVRYADEHRGKFPQAYSAPQSGYTQIAWDFNTTTDGRYEPGVLFGQACHGEVYQCPSFKGASMWGGQKFSGYNYNTSYIGHGYGESPNPEPANIADVRNPSGCALFGDGEYGAGANKFMRAPFNDPDPSRTGGEYFSGRYAGTQGFRHRKKTNVAFVDGHAESIKQRYTKTVPWQMSNVAPDTGFLSEDNSMYDLE